MPSVWQLSPVHRLVLGTRSFTATWPTQIRSRRPGRVSRVDSPATIDLLSPNTPRRRLEDPSEATRQGTRETTPRQSKTVEPQQKPDASTNPPSSSSPISSSPQSNGKDRPISTIPPSILYEHWDLAPPSKADLKESRAFFTKHPAKLLFTASKLLDVPFTTTPEIAIVGRSNVGKSTLLNALLQTELARTSSKPGKTKTMNAYDLGGGKLTLLDMPGYGRASRTEWGVEITKYLQRRKELRRVFVLIDAVHQPDRGRVKCEDLEMLAQLRELHIPHQIVLGKIDRALFTREMRPPFTEADLARSTQRIQAIFADVRRTVWGGSDAGLHVEGGEEPESALQMDGLKPFGQLLATTGDSGRWAKMSDERGGALGVDALRWALLVATGLAKVLPSRVVQERKAGKKAADQMAIS